MKEMERASVLKKEREKESKGETRAAQGIDENVLLR